MKFINKIEPGGYIVHPSRCNRSVLVCLTNMELRWLRLLVALAFAAVLVKCNGKHSVLYHHSIETNYSVDWLFWIVSSQLILYKHVRVACLFSLNINYIPAGVV